jgi:hypothetical protein
MDTDKQHDGNGRCWRQETIGRSTCVRGEAKEKKTRERGKSEGERGMTAGS